jgi:hypothetical protein
MEKWLRRSTKENLLLAYLHFDDKMEARKLIVELKNERRDNLPRINLSELSGFQCVPHTPQIVESIIRNAESGK